MVEVIANFDARGKERMLQQLSVLLSTPVESVPFDRDFGVDMSFLDMPAPEAKSLFLTQAAEKMERYTPGLRLESVDFEMENSKLTPKVVVGIES